MSYMKIILVGNVGSDGGEMRYMPDGTAVTNFSVAVNRTWKTAEGEKREETTWFRVETWRRQAEIVNQYLSKGDRVLVEGRIKPDPATGGPRLWTRQDGSMGASFEIVADTVRFLGGSDSEASGGQRQQQPQQGAAPSQRSAAPRVVEEDDIPF
jgi:single-strand DNA-binding protein